MPRSIMYAIGGMMVIYLALNVGVVPWQDAAESHSVASLAVTAPSAPA